MIRIQSLAAGPRVLANRPGLAKASNQRRGKRTITPLILIRNKRRQSALLRAALAGLKTLVLKNINATIRAFNWVSICWSSPTLSPLQRKRLEGTNRRSVAGVANHSARHH